MITLWLDGVSNTITLIVARYRESIPRRQLTFESFCPFAKSEYEFYRAQVHQITATLPCSQ